MLRHSASAGMVIGLLCMLAGGAGATSLGDVLGPEHRDHSTEHWLVEFVIGFVDGVGPLGAPTHGEPSDPAERAAA